MNNVISLNSSQYQTVASPVALGANSAMPESMAERWNRAETAEAVTAPFTVQHTKDSTRDDLSKQWRSRPEDQRFVSLSDLEKHVSGMAENSRMHVINSAEIQVIANPEKPDDLQFAYKPEGDNNTREIVVNPTVHSFGQAARLANAPAKYLRHNLPAVLAAANLQYGLQVNRAELVKTYFDERDGTLRAMTGPEYGRIYDREIVEAVRRIAGNGTGDTRWKVPGAIDWTSRGNSGGVVYNPFVDITKENTTLYASDKDVWMFLVDDTHPINIGTEDKPDYVFRGFYAWNSEVGAATAGVAQFLLRGICCNRIMWGVSDFVERSFRHSKNAPFRFGNEIKPALLQMSEQSAMPILAGVNAAKNTIVAEDDKEAAAWLKRNTKATEATIPKVLKAVLDEEGKPARSVWDMVQGLTAFARTKTNADARIDIEKQAGALMEKAARRAA